MNTNLRDRYTRLRKANRYMPANHAIAVARREVAPQWAEDFDTDTYGMKMSGTVNGHEIVIRTEVDDVQDISFLGEFTDDPTDAIPNPEYQRGRYKYFRPDAFQVESIESLRRVWGKVQAQEVRAIRLDETVRAALMAQEVVIVEVIGEYGDVTGTATLAGCFNDTLFDALWTAHDHGMVDEAIANAGADVAA